MLLCYPQSGTKRKPPPMHRKRRLREPGKIHRRRRNCIMRAVTLLCVFPVKFLRLSRDASQVRRDWATVLRLPAREICFITAAPAFIPAPQRLHIVPQNQVCGEKRRTYGFAAADLSGLSLPDAPCEHTDIRGKPKNLTKDFLPPIRNAVKSADRSLPPSSLERFAS